MYKKNGKKGITLIALVITIIVLLILAGISIAMLTGDNSILTNATKARKENAISSVKEQVLMAVNTAYTEYHAKSVTDTLEDDENLYDDTKDALTAITSNNSEVSYDTEPGKDENDKDILIVTIQYKSETPTVTGTLNADGSFKWNP